MAIFEKFRVSLAYLENLPLLGDADKMVDNNKKMERKEFLNNSFSSEVVFRRKNNNSEIIFSPLSMGSGYVGGWFKRLKPLNAKKKDLSHYEVENYESAFFIISTNSEQIAWLEHNIKLGATSEILKDYFRYLSLSGKGHGFTAFVENISDIEDYWSAINNFRGQITKLVFMFIPPNALGASDIVKSFNKRLFEDGNATTQTHIHKGEPGQLNPEGETMAASANIAMEGGGIAEVRGERNKLLFSNKDHKITIKIKDDLLPSPESPHLIITLVGILFNQ